MLLFKLNFLGMLLLQEVGFDLRSMWAQMGPTAKAVVVILAVMSAWCIGVMIDRYLAFSSARKQSREFAPAVAGCLKEGKIEEAISVAEQNKKSHLAKVVEAGLQEFRAHSVSRELSGEQIESSRRACERAEAIVNAELKRGLSGLATIGATHLSWVSLEPQSVSSTPSKACRLKRPPDCRL
jgi:biopolymer transport protein ExbB/biopolymer transport protein TolQ